MQSFRRLIAIVSLSFLFSASQAQPVNDLTIKKETKPYKLLTSGKQITIKSSKGIKHIMLWTISGNRVVEQRGIKNSYYTLTIPVNQKAFYLMIGLEGGKIYTEKIGIQ